MSLARKAKASAIADELPILVILLGAAAAVLTAGVARGLKHPSTLMPEFG